MDQTRSDVAHLYRRAGFGARPAELEAAARAGYPATVETLLAGMGRAPDPTGDRVNPPTFAPYQARSGAKGSPQARAEATARARRDAVGLRQLQEWWLSRMVVTSTPLREKMTLLWHGHFATGISKVRDPHLMYLQNQSFRTMGGGSFEDLTQAVAKGGAMMAWLDTATDKASHPNENFARELMEVFTLGVGNYTQNDVEASARAFTGWTYDRTTDQWHLRYRQHDDGNKTFLGRTGNLSGEDVISIIVGQPASARFVVAKVWSHLAYPVAPGDPVVDDLVSRYLPGYDITELLRAVFLHPAFLSPTARAGLVKQPVEYVVGSGRALGLDASAAPALATMATATGQTLFNPPNVGGWPQNGYWLNTATALARAAAAPALARRADLSPLEALGASQRPGAVADMLGLDGWGATSAAALAHAASDPPTLVALALTAPEYVLA